MVQEMVDMLKNYYALTVSKKTLFGSFQNYLQDCIK